MMCQACGVEAPTKYVAFYQNIGALVMRFHKSMEGELCKGCIHKYFWEFTGITMLVGWFGTISLIITPFFLLNNFFRYLTCLTMPGVPEGAVPAELTEDAVNRLHPYTREIFDRIGQDEPFPRVIEDVGMRAGVTPGQVSLYVRAVVAAARNRQG